ncbi:MAG TPA: hypothetical protein VHE34_02845 [Puia sp.]|uniref:baeRF3 domain-containing protein n=1 Tax=Puia sp. TaxID=2045100 RepID=UPI002B785C28|nr:hypothetical protein [Puia sp.]HVU94127.1 hypothetical protein [Puia sp.]
MIKYPSTAIYKDIMGRVPIPPAVSLLLPFHPVFSSHAELKHRVKIALENARHELLRNYTAETTLAVMEKLARLEAQLDYATPHKSIALFASAHLGKLWYFDTPVEERLTIGDTFAVRDLVADSKQLRNYLILLLSDKECRFYLAGEDRLERLPASAPTEVFAYVNEKPERVANFSDPGQRKEIVMDKFLHYMDDELSQVLTRHPFPVFLMGPEKVIGHFKAHSGHLPQIAACLHGNYIDTQEFQLLQLIQPALEAWRRQNKQSILTLVRKAADDKRLSTGITAAWSDAWHNKARLLVVEKGYRFPARRGDTPDQIFREDSAENNPFYIPDAVDALIGQVIANGGDVEFVDDGDLAECQHVALIRYY